MSEVDDNSIDCLITSPPYDNLRDYGGYEFDFEPIARELYRIIRNGGVVVWVVGDATIHGSETGTSFKQALYFKKIGFNLHDTMIYQKDVMPFPERNRYNQCFEYMFIFSKGKPKTFNPIKVATKGYKPSNSNTTRGKNGLTSLLKYEQGKPMRSKFNIWFFTVGYMKSTKDKIAFEHPAIFPDQLAIDHILSWSNENDIILDPMAGSGTTLAMAKRYNRQYIGYEINKKYIPLIRKRLAKEDTLFNTGKISQNGNPHQ